MDPDDRVIMESQCIKLQMGKWKLMLAINCYHLILSRHTNAQYFQIPSCKTSIRKEFFCPKTIRDWNNLPAPVTAKKVLTRSRDYCLHINFKSDVFICTCIFFLGIAQTSFATFGLFQYARAHQIQWQNSQPNDSGHIVVEVEVSPLKVV